MQYRITQRKRHGEAASYAKAIEDAARINLSSDDPPEDERESVTTKKKPVTLTDARMFSTELCRFGFENMSILEQHGVTADTMLHVHRLCDALMSMQYTSNTVDTHITDYFHQAATNSSSDILNSSTNSLSDIVNSSTNSMSDILNSSTHSMSYILNSSTSESMRSDADAMFVDSVSECNYARKGFCLCVGLDNVQLKECLCGKKLHHMCQTHWMAKNLQDEEEDTCVRCHDCLVREQKERRDGVGGSVCTKD